MKEGKKNVADLNLNHRECGCIQLSVLVLRTLTFKLTTTYNQQTED